MMIQIPNDPSDKGYYNIAEPILEKILFLDKTLTFLFKTVDEASIKIHLHDVAAYDFNMQAKTLTLLRVDGDGGTYGFDIALRLGNPELKDYMVLYLFEDESHTGFLFRGLARRIYVETV